jgi:hypothetical protein
MKTCLPAIGLVLLGGCAGVETGSDSDAAGGAKDSTAHDGLNGSETAPRIVASDYNQSCSSAADCVLVAAGVAACDSENPCANLCLGCIGLLGGTQPAGTQWATDAINRSELDRFNAALATALDAGCNESNGCIVWSTSPGTGVWACNQPNHCDAVSCFSPTCVDGACRRATGRIVDGGACLEKAGDQ